MAFSTWRRLRPTTVLACAALGLVAPAQAQTITWVGGTGQNQWGNNNNWSPNGQPSASTTAIFPPTASSLTPFVNIPNAMAGALEFNSPGYTLNLTSGHSELTISGAGIIGSSPTPTINLGPGTDIIHFLNASGSGAATFNINSGGLADFTNNSNAQTATFFINNGGRASFSQNSTGGMATFNINPGGTLDLSGHAVPGFPTPTNMTAEAINNGGQIILATTPLVAGNTLTVLGAYTGTGGNIALNTFLGTDNSPSDRLIIQGTATGSTTLTIHNTTGPGAETLGNGIPVVVTTPNGTTAAGAFMLPPNTELRAVRLTIVCSAATPPTSMIPRPLMIGSCARPSSCRRCRLGRCRLGRCRRCPLSRPTRRHPCCRRASIQSSGRSLRPTAWCSPSRGRWACKRSAHCTNGSVTR
jgi:hypothetical protein